MGLKDIIIVFDFCGGFFGGLIALARLEDYVLKRFLRGLQDTPSPSERRSLRRKYYLVLSVPLVALLVLSIRVHPSPFLWGLALAFCLGAGFRDINS